MNIEIYSATAAQIISIVGVIYGFFWIRNFKKQKRIEHLCINAKEALTALRESERDIRELCLAKHAVLDAQKGTLKDHYHLQLRILSSLGFLRDLLLLIQWDADLVRASDMDIINEWQHILKTILGYNYSEHAPTSDFFINLNGLDKHDNDKFENMREVLRHIYMLKIKH